MQQWIQWEWHILCGCRWMRYQYTQLRWQRYLHQLSCWKLHVRKLVMCKAEMQTTIISSPNWARARNRIEARYLFLKPDLGPKVKFAEWVKICETELFCWPSNANMTSFSITNRIFCWNRYPNQFKSVFVVVKKSVSRPEIGPKLSDKPNSEPRPQKKRQIYNSGERRYKWLLSNLWFCSCINICPSPQE